MEPKGKLSLSMPGEPMAKQRAKWMKYGTYTPEKTVSYETYIKQLFAIKYPDFTPLEGPLVMTIHAWVMIPKSTSEKKRKLMKEIGIRPVKRPDWDNIGKIASDALEGLAYKNDAQIVTGIVYKLYSERPRLEITISW